MESIMGRTSVRLSLRPKENVDKNSTLSIFSVRSAKCIFSQWCRVTSPDLMPESNRNLTPIATATRSDCVEAPTATAATSSLQHNLISLLQLGVVSLGRYCDMLVWDKVKTWFFVIPYYLICSTPKLYRYAQKVIEQSKEDLNLKWKNIDSFFMICWLLTKEIKSINPDFQSYSDIYITKLSHFDAYVSSHIMTKF